MLPHVLLRLGEGYAIAEVTPPAWESAGTYSASSDRMTLSALLTPDPGPGPFAPWAGVKPAHLDTGLQVTALSTPSMYVQVNTGSCFVPAAIQANAGWICHNNGQRQVAIAAADATHPRIDLIIAHVYDAVDDSGTLNEWQLEPVTGTPAAVPAAGAVPTNAIVLAQVAVAANALTITSGNVTDVRAWTVALGGVLPVNGLSAVPAGYAGHYVHDRSTGRLAHNPAGGAVQPHLLPFTPVGSKVTADVAVSQSSTVTLTSCGFTCDGVTDIEVTYKWAGIQQGTTVNSSLSLQLFLDSAQVDGVFVAMDSSMGSLMGYQGGCVVFRTRSADGNTPSAGAHTLTLKATNNSGGGNIITVICRTYAPTSLYVKPVCQ